MNRTKFIRELIKEKPEQYLRTIQVRVNDKLINIGLFKCEKCNKPISDKQFNFARCCASCDVGENNPEWVIEKPETQEFENSIDIDNIDEPLSI